MDFLSPWSLAGLVLVPAIFLWGLLAPRGRRVVVGSLVLWRRALGAGPVGRPSARVRLRDPLLWLDAAAVLLLVLACARPGVLTQKPTEPVATLVIDRTASMMIRQEGGTRAELVAPMIERVLHQAGDVPIRVLPVPGEDGGVYASASIGANAFTDKGAPWAPMLAARDIWPEVIGLASCDKDLPVVVSTDIAPTVDLPPNVYVLAPGGVSKNAGLVRVSSRIAGDKAWLLVEGRAAPEAVGPTWACMVQGGNLGLSRDFSFMRRGTKLVGQAIIPLKMPLRPGLQVSLVTPGGLLAAADDVFPYDDKIWMSLWPRMSPDVLVVGRLDPLLQRAFVAAEVTRIVEAAAGTSAASAKADLVVAAGAPLPADWKGPAIVVTPSESVGPIRPLDGEVQAEWQVNHQHPLAESLYAGAPQVGKVRRYQVGPGGQIMVGTAEAPLLITWEEQGARRLAVLFLLDEKTTDWTRRESFPIFWAYALDWLVPFDRRPAEYVPRLSPDSGFIGSDEPFQSGPGRDDSEAAIRAIRASAAAHLRAAHTELWPLLAAAALVVLLARGWVAR
jgi:hypothetical protein